ncbi:MAG TPA: pilus assembly protein TadG-related protein [Propionicimonas sp.]|jgi:hypothetical protein
MVNNLVNRRRERGAVAVIVALMMVVIMASAALGVDIAKLVYGRQQLQNSLDAAATAGAMHLPDDPAAAIADAQKFAADNMIGANLGSITPNIALRCVVGYNATTKSPDWATVVSVCGITSKAWNVTDCNDQICSVVATLECHCNTIIVKDSLTVNYSFGPAIGIPTGNTGTITSAACRGFCGTVSPNPLDIVVMADRTPSMVDGWDGGSYTTPNGSFRNMKAGIEDMLGSMNQDQQYVAFGTIAISVPTVSDAVAPPNGGNAFSDAIYVTCSGGTCTPSWSKGGKKYHFNGNWVPVGFTNRYTKTDAAGVTSIDTTSALYKAVHNLDFSGPDEKVNYPDADTGRTTSSNEGTHLASAMKGAARYLLNVDPTTNAGLPLRPKEFGTPKKVIIFETDGSPSEIFTSDSSATTLSNSLDIGVAGNGNRQSCDNLSAIASEAKAANIKIITIGVGAVNQATCGSSAGKTLYVRDVLAGAASPTKSGAASDAYDCTQAGKTEAENADGDNYFCAATSADLKSVFVAAMGSLTKTSKLMALPNVSS